MSKWKGYRNIGGKEIRCSEVLKKKEEDEGLSKTNFSTKSFIQYSFIEWYDWF